VATQPDPVFEKNVQKSDCVFYHCDIMICHALRISITLSQNFAMTDCCVAVRALELLQVLDSKLDGVTLR